MSKAGSFDYKLAQLKDIRSAGACPETLSVLRSAIESKISLMAARAAEIAADFEALALTDALERAFSRFMINPVKADPGCRAKTAIADALYRMGASSQSVFLAGVAHVQKEPSYGPPVDTAPTLRGTCALGLIRMNYPQAMYEVARLLDDAEPDARIMAARAIAYSSDPRGEPLLRFKIHLGDPQPQVLAECLLALLRLEPQGSLDFVSSWLDSSDSHRMEAAVTALGESRMPQALAPLSLLYRRSMDQDIRQIVLLAIATLRCDSGIEFLVNELASAEGTRAQAVLTALATFRNDQTVRRRVADLVERAKDRGLARMFREYFGE